LDQLAHWSGGKSHSGHALNWVNPWALVNHYMSSNAVKVTIFTAEITDRTASFNEPAIVENQLPRPKAIVEMMDIDEHKKWIG